jgi:hypothetical protein
MTQHLNIHKLPATPPSIHKASEALRVLVSPPSAASDPFVTVYFRDIEAVRNAYGCLLPHLNDITHATLQLTAAQPSLRYPLSVFSSVSEHIALLAAMGVSRIALPFIADSMNKAIIRSRQAHDSFDLGQLIISTLEAAKAPQESPTEN